MTREWREHDARSGALLLGMVEGQAHELEALRREVRRLREELRDAKARLVLIAVELED